MCYIKTANEHYARRDKCIIKGCYYLKVQMLKQYIDLCKEFNKQPPFVGLRLFKLAFSE